MQIKIPLIESNPRMRNCRYSKSGVFTSAIPKAGGTHGCSGLESSLSPKREPDSVALRQLTRWVCWDDSVPSLGAGDREDGSGATRGGHFPTTTNETQNPPQISAKIDSYCVIRAQICSYTHMLIRYACSLSPRASWELQKIEKAMEILFAIFRLADKIMEW